MKKLFVALLLIFAVFLQVSWGMYLRIGNFTFPSTLLVLLLSASYLSTDWIFGFAFGTGLLLDLLGASLLGSHALGLILGLAGYTIVREKLLERPWLARLSGALISFVVYQAWLWILVKTLPIT